ncbi:C-type mannose receptor 2-like [Chanos chanos]|uniref:C-type mannose receptor 2-like n=1 Tax=Chanos chanos TaxID=29144 RepID=A0A6J2VTL2_CHACN|nr:C-type mannose receptor 2-like [Chanos chanos]
MNHSWLFIVLLKGVCGSASGVPRQFYAVNENKMWNEAQKHCREYFTDLATIDNMQEYLRDKKKIDNDKVWIGLFKDVWWWSDGSPVKYRNWDDSEPNNQGQDNCVEFLKSGKWNDAACHHENYFLCFDGNHPYKLITEQKSWSEAQSYCREQYTDMVTVRNETENEKISEMITSDKKVWIGLYRDNWAWSDGSKSSFRYWNKKQPDNQGGIENCAEITPHTRDWNDQRCSVQQPFVCYQDKLVLIRENKTWSEALNHCRNNHVDLVSVHDENMIRWVKERSKNATTDYVWMGLRFSCTLGFWFWVDGESVCYQNLVPGNWTAVEACQDEVLTGAIQSRGQQQEWVSLPETHKLNFICSAYEGSYLSSFRPKLLTAALNESGFYMPTCALTNTPPPPPNFTKRTLFPPPNFATTSCH